MDPESSPSQLVLGRLALRDLTRWRAFRLYIAFCNIDFPLADRSYGRAV